MLYGKECWAVKNQHDNKISVAGDEDVVLDIGKTRWEKIRNDYIRERVGVAPII